MSKNIFWHDGILEELRLIAPTRRRLGSVEVDLSLYPTDQSVERGAYTLICSQVLGLEIVGNMLELQDNAAAGNIEDGTLKNSKGKFEADLRMIGGRLWVRASNIKLRKRRA